MLTATPWEDYKLIDSGDGEKLESWAGFIIRRPEPRAIWTKTDHKLWKNIDGEFVQDKWNFVTQPPAKWIVRFNKLKFNIKSSNFKHTGVFPEQSVNWKWMEETLKRSDTGQQIKVLNLFGYTGGASMSCALAGREISVTHVDSSRPSLMWASENVSLSGIEKGRIRWIQDDALKFVQREQRRGVKYEAIVMDPPKFGRGANGEVWKLEDNLAKLVHECKKILSPSPIFMLVNAYTADLSHIAIRNILTDVFGEAGKIETDEVGIEQVGGGRILPAGIVGRWSL